LKDRISIIEDAIRKVVKMSSFIEEENVINLSNDYRGLKGLPPLKEIK